MTAIGLWRLGGIVPEALDCPCGAVVTDPDGAITYWTDELLDLALGAIVSKVKYLGALAPFVGATVDVQSICSNARIPMPSFSLLDFANFHVLNAKIAQALANWAYRNLCTCLPCPPATTCNTGTCYTVTSADGYPRPGFETQHYQYKIDPGAEIFVARGDGFCLGEKNGVLITWTMMDVPGGPYGVQVCDGSGSGCVSYDVAGVGQGVQLCFEVVDAPPTYPWPEAPSGVADWHGPPACTTSDICTALEYVYQAIRRIEFLTTVIAGPEWGVTGVYDMTLPGASTPISGVLNQFLPRALTALAGITPAQLTNPVATPITESSLIDVSDAAYVSITLDAVAPATGSRGAGDSRIYYSNHRSPGPGWVVVMGPLGVLEHRELLYPGGLDMALPPAATDIAVHLAAGTTATVTTYQRDV